MKRKLIEKLQESLVVCDNPKCTFSIPYNEEEAKNTIRYINVPCPQCGENLLTAEDYLLHEKMVKVVDWLNKWFSWTMYLVPKKVYNKKNTVSFHVHDGVKIKKENNESTIN